jgi:hypothetical protein
MVNNPFIFGASPAWGRVSDDKPEVTVGETALKGVAVPIR